MALGVALGLSVDEAHYALYATHLALSYFDHPPMVGWVQWPLVALGVPDSVLRLIPGALWLGTVLIARRIAMVLAPDVPDGGTWTVVVLFLAPLLHVLGIGLLPDTLLMFLSAALMLLTLRMVRNTAVPGMQSFILLGVLLGLSGLSKYTAIFSALAVAACLLQAHGIRILRSPGLWLAVVIALVMVSPVAIWNAQNQWISFGYQAKHGSGNAWAWINVLRFALVQCVAYGPLPLWGFAGLGRVAKLQRSILLFFAIPIAILLALSGGGTGLPHWTAPAWVALAPFAGVALARSWQSAHSRWLITALVAMQALTCAGLLALMVSGGMPFMAGRAASAQDTNPPNPFADLHGWDKAGARALALANASGLDSASVQNWTLASRIGWYARPLPVHVLEDRFDQFDLWAGKLPVGGNTLLVDWSQQPYVTPLGAHGFQTCRLLDHLDIHRWGYPLAVFDFYDCRGWSGDPAPALKPAFQPGTKP
jgi:4-amino-4-deoxy-L-arabinose transferase-like glycosyltransferase